MEGEDNQVQQTIPIATCSFQEMDDVWAKILSVESVENDKVISILFKFINEK